MLSKVTVDEICRLVKEDGEKVKLEVGKWYTATNDDGDENKCCFFVTKIYGNKFDAYGFNYKGVYRENSTYFGHVVGSVSYQPASPKTVEQYLRDEAVKKYKVGDKIQPLKDWFYGKENDMILDNISESVLENNNLVFVNASSKKYNTCVFKDGQWATIIQPETITRAEAEKRYDVKITD